MDPQVISALITGTSGLITGLLATLITLWVMRINKDEDRVIKEAADSILQLMRENIESGKPNLCYALFSNLKSKHHMDVLIPAFYRLRFRGIIEWKKKHILKPKHEITFVVR